MAIRLTIQEDRPKLTVGQGSAIPLRASSGYPIYENNYDNLRNKPSINGVDLVGDKTTEDLHIEVSGGVTSWNGQTGDVVYTPPEAPVQSVNGQTGNVVLNASDVGALPSNTPIPSKTSDLQNDSGFITSADIPPIPSKTSELTNDSGYITGIDSTDVTSALGYTPYNATNPSGYVNATQAASAAPVQSVNGQTGAVSLTIPTVPTNVSAFNNDAGYLTSNDIGSVFTLKGSVYQYSDLPTTGNTEGDVYYVEEDETISGTLYPGQVGYIWITNSNNVARWEELGQTIDTSEFQPLITTNGVLQGNGSGNISAITVDTTPTANSSNLVTSGGVRAAIPTNVSSLNNDSGYLTLATLPVWDGGVI